MMCSSLCLPVTSTVAIVIITESKIFFGGYKILEILISKYFTTYVPQNILAHKSK